MTVKTASKTADKVTTTTIDNLTFDNVKLVKVAGMALLGICQKSGESSFRIDGINCGNLPEKADFTNLFKSFVADKCISTTIDQANDVITLEMKGPQRIAFAGAYAEFKEAMSMMDTTLAEIALSKILS